MGLAVVRQVLASRMIIGLFHMIYGDEKPQESSCLILDSTYEFLQQLFCRILVYVGTGTS